MPEKETLKRAREDVLAGAEGWLIGLSLLIVPFALGWMGAAMRERKAVVAWCQPLCVRNATTTLRRHADLRVSRTDVNKTVQKVHGPQCTASAVQRRYEMP